MISRMKFLLCGIGILSFHVCFGIFLEDYDKNDFRNQTYHLPFPTIAHYDTNSGNYSESWFDITRILNISDCPSSLQIYLLPFDKKDVCIYEAYCALQQTNCNYFLHCWAMSDMTKQNSLNVASGLWEPQNLEVLNQEIGIHSLVDQKMTLTSQMKLGENVARFKVLDTNRPADGWFVSKYQSKIIVVHWFFINPTYYGTFVPYGMKKINLTNKS